MLFESARDSTGKDPAFVLTLSQSMESSRSDVGRETEMFFEKLPTQEVQAQRNVTRA